MSADTAAFAPIDAPRRNLALDAIRGFALLGLFLMNVEWVSRPMQALVSAIAHGSTGLHHAVALPVYWFVKGQFSRRFSLLFGMGFAVMQSRAAYSAKCTRSSLPACT